MAKWCVEVSGATHELEWDELKEWARMGRLNLTDRARWVTEDEWRTVGQIPELVRMFPPRPPGSMNRSQLPDGAKPGQSDGRSPSPAPTSAKANILAGVAIAVPLVLALVSAVIVAFSERQGSGNQPSAVTEKKIPTVVTASDASCQITLPPGWTKVDLTQGAVIQAGSPEDEMYISIMSGEMEGYWARDLESLSRETFEYFLQNNRNAKVYPIPPIVIAGSRVANREITFTDGNTPMRGFFIVALAKNRFFQILVCSSAKRFEANLKSIKELPLSFRPIGGGELFGKITDVTLDVMGEGGRKIGSYRFLNDGRPITLDSVLKASAGAQGIRTVSIPRTALPLEVTVNGRKFRLTEGRLLEGNCQWKAEGETLVPVFLSRPSEIVESPPINVKTRPLDK